MSNEKKLVFERIFRSESYVDELMDEIIRRNSQIDDRTRHVFDLDVGEAIDVPPDERNADEKQQTAPDHTQGAGERTEDGEGVKIYSVRRRLRRREEDAEGVKIYKVRHRIRKDTEKKEDLNDDITKTP